MTKPSKMKQYKKYFDKCINLNDELKKLNDKLNSLWNTLSEEEKIEIKKYYANKYRIFIA
jgi:hypothetical protein